MKEKNVQGERQIFPKETQSRVLRVIETDALITVCFSLQFHEFLISSTKMGGVCVIEQRKQN